eukprot:gene22029-29088_t
MAPKKKAGAKKDKKKDGVPSGDVEGASLERDKINAFYEITKKELDDRKAELRNKDREGEEMEVRHQVEVKVYKQKVKHLLYEHQDNITTLKADGELALKLQQDDFRYRESGFGKDKRSLKPS